MTTARASSSTRAKVLSRPMTQSARDFNRRFREWTVAYDGFRERLPPEPKARFDLLGRTLWRFDLRQRWASGITAIEFDDRIVEKATTAATKQGYFLLMRLVDHWFSLDLAHDLFQHVCLDGRVEHPNVIETLRRNGGRRLRVASAAARATGLELHRLDRKPDTKGRVLGWIRGLADVSPDGVATRCAEEAAAILQTKAALEPQHVASIASLVRNQYVHGGETASSHGLPAQEKVPVLRVFVGFLSIAGLTMATEATEDMLKRVPQLARF